MDWKFFGVLQSAFAFFCIFASFNTQSTIQVIVINSYQNYTHENIDPKAGYYSNAIVYASFTLCNFVAAPVVNLATPKWAMVLGSLTYLLMLVSFLWLMEWLLYLTSAIVGFGAAIIWTGQGSYMTLNSTDETMGRNSALFWAFLQAGLLVGGTFLYFVFGDQGISTMDLHRVRQFYGVFSGCCGVGVVLLIFLPQTSKSVINRQLNAPPSDVGLATVSSEIDVGDSTIKNDLPPSTSTTFVEKMRKTWAEWIVQTVKTFKLLFTGNMLLLLIVFVYTGIEQSFWAGVYPSSLGFTDKFTLGARIVALHTFLVGAGQTIGGGTFGIFGAATRKFGRNPVVMLGCAVHLICFFFIFLNIPTAAPNDHTADVAFIKPPNEYLALVCSFLVGFADACWNTQIYSLLGTLYPDETSAQAFALWKAFQSVASCASFFYGGRLYLDWQLLLLVVLNTAAAVCFFPVEWQAQMRPRSSHNQRTE